MTHEVAILYKPEYLARKWGCVCLCGWMSGNVTEEEAIESKKIHLEQNDGTRSTAVAEPKV
jgi:hypothetical protein